MSGRATPSELSPMNLDDIPRVRSATDENVSRQQ